MTYLELNENEKQELRNTLYFESIYNAEDSYLLCDLTNDQQDLISNCNDAEDISENIMAAIFECFDFVPEDFWCNIDEKTECNNGINTFDFLNLGRVQGNKEFVQD